MKRSALFAAASALLLLLAACSEVHVTGAFGDRPLRVSGTVAAWIDETEYVVDSAGGAPVLRDRATDAVLMHLFFTEAVFDPRVDFRALPAGERSSLLDDIERGDRLLVDVRRGNVVRAGDPIELVSTSGELPPEILPFIDKVVVSLGQPVIDEATTYPDRAEQVGGDVDAKLDVAETSPQLVGSLTVAATKAQGQGDGFLEGEVTIDFGTELLPERLAECNFAEFAAGVVNACDLN